MICPARQILPGPIELESANLKGTEMMFQRLLLVGLMVCLTNELAAQQMPSPSAEHKILMKDVGEWTIEGKMLTPEGFQAFKGEEKVVTVGGFWTVSHYSSDIFGGLKGSCTIGYDPKTKKFVGTWVDSFQPTATRMIGTYDEKAKTMTYDTTGMGMDGKPMPGKIIVHYKSDNAHSFTMMHKDPTGQTDEMVKTMEMTYKRK